MKLEQQVVSLELARKLKELGVRQDSYFWWHFGEKESWINTYGGQPNHFVPSVAAFTVAELGQLLPRKFGYNELHTVSCPNKDTFAVFYEDYKKEPSLYQEADTEADARAKMLVYLIEQGIVKP